MNRLTITGQQGSVKWGYATAAELGPWSLSAEPAGGTLTGTVVSVDDFKASQQPLMFVVSRPNGVTWTWPVTRCSIAGATLTAEVGPAKE